MQSNDRLFAAHRFQEEEPETQKVTQLSRIEWTEATWNPTVGCTKISPGCKHCYAETMAKRLQAKGHEDYWLIHLSQHHRARDVMTEVHWDNSNYFIHYGGAGLDMFQMIGYDPDHDAEHRGQSGLGFEFDNIARKASIKALNDQIPRRVYANDEGLSFGVLFATTCNDSPASAEIYRESVGHLIDHKIIEVISEDGVKRRSAQQIKANDQIIPPLQRGLFVI